MPRITLEQARAAKDAALRRLRDVEGLAGVGITRVDGEYAVKVNLRTAPGPGVELPAEIDGVRVRIEIVGEIRRR